MSQIVEAKPESVGPSSQRLARIKPGWSAIADDKAARRGGGDRGARPYSATVNTARLLKCLAASLEQSGALVSTRNLASVRDAPLA
jgi:hypothetical protein